MSDIDQLAKDDFARDATAARSDLVGRREQLLADFDQRLQALDQLSDEVVSDVIAMRAAQSQLRELIAEGRGGGIRQAGRTRIGLSAPSASEVAAGGRTALSVDEGVKTQSLFVKMRAEIDMRIVALLQQYGGSGQKEMCADIVLLLHIRCALVAALDDWPRDAVLLGSLAEYATESQQTLIDLQEQGAQHVMQMVRFGKVLAAQTVAHGGNVKSLRAPFETIQNALKAPDPDVPRLLRKTSTEVERLRAEILKKSCAKSRLIDDLLAR